MGHLLNSGNTGASFLIWDSCIYPGFGRRCRPGPQRPRIRALYNLTSPMGRWKPACSETAAEKGHLSLQLELAAALRAPIRSGARRRLQGSETRAGHLATPRPHRRYCSYHCSGQYLGRGHITIRLPRSRSAAKSSSTSPARTAGTNPTIMQLSCHALERLHLEQLLPGDAAPAPAASSQPPQQQPQLAHPA